VNERIRLYDKGVQVHASNGICTSPVKRSIRVIHAGYASIRSRSHYAFNIRDAALNASHLLYSHFIEQHPSSSPYNEERPNVHWYVKAKEAS